MGKIRIEDMEVYAYHGHMPEENKIGGRFLVNLEIDVDLEAASQSDVLADTFDYETAYRVVKEEMKTSSALLEEVAGRILRRLLDASSLVQSAKVKLSKMNPPFDGRVKAVSVELYEERRP